MVAVPIRLTDSRLREPLQAAQMVLPDLRDVFLQRVAVELQGKDLGDGLVHPLLTRRRVRSYGTPGGRRRQVRRQGVGFLLRVEPVVMRPDPVRCGKSRPVATNGGSGR